MNILFVDTSISGHHITYMRALSQIEGLQCHYMLPAECNIPGTIHIRTLSFQGKNIIRYLRWLLEIRKIARLEKVKMIHILNGDLLYRYCGFLLGLLSKEFELVGTFHHEMSSRFRNISYRRIFGRLQLGVVHAQSMEYSLRKAQISNVCLIHYPNQLPEDYPETDHKILKRSWGIPEDCKVILFTGETRYEKGIDLLIKALNQVTGAFYLIVAGRIKDFDEPYLKQAIKFSQYRLLLNQMNEEELSELYRITDIVVLPYRRSYDGASSSLWEGAVYEKIMIGPDHGSFGHIIKNHHLGYVFETENLDALAETIEMALASDFSYDEKALTFSESLSIHEFCSNYKNLYETIAG